MYSKCIDSMQVAGSNNTLINMSKHWIQYSRKQRCNDNTLQYPVVFTNKSQCWSISHTIPHVKPYESILSCVQTTQGALYFTAQLLTTSPIWAWKATTGTTCDILTNLKITDKHLTSHPILHKALYLLQKQTTLTTQNKTVQPIKNPWQNPTLPSLNGT